MSQSKKIILVPRFTNNFEYKTRYTDKTKLAILNEQVKKYFASIDNAERFNYCSVYKLNKKIEQQLSSLTSTTDKTDKSYIINKSFNYYFDTKKLSEAKFKKLMSQFSLTDEEHNDKVRNAIKAKYYDLYFAHNKSREASFGLKEIISYVGNKEIANFEKNKAFNGKKIQFMLYENSFKNLQKAARNMSMYPVEKIEEKELESALSELKTRKIRVSRSTDELQGDRRKTKKETLRGMFDRLRNKLDNRRKNLGMKLLVV